MRLLPSLLLTAALASTAGAAQFHVPLHLPPHRCVPEAGAGKEFLLGLGAASATGAGLAASGPQGYWEFGALGSNNVGFSARGYGAALSGKVDPLRAGHSGGGGMSGGFELDLLAAPHGKDGWRVYAGALAGLTSLDIRDPLTLTAEGSGLRVEPDNAFSVFLGLPVGVLVPVRLSKTWRLELQADAVVFPAGVSFFSYTGLPPMMFGTSRRIDLHYGGGTRAGLLYAPWGLLLEAAFRFSTGTGNNSPLSYSALSAGLKLF